MTSTDAADHLADLRPNYFARLRKRVDALNAFLQALERNEATESSFEDGHRCVHSMISSAAIFGYSDLSAAARAAEAAFEAESEKSSVVIKSRVEHVLRLTRDVLEMADDGDN